jgi:L-fucose mutarotase
VVGMVPDGDHPTQPIASHVAVTGILTAAERRSIGVASLNRTSFYEEAKKAFAVVLTGETRSYACFLLTKGVVNPAPARVA